ncbi:apolipoprotein N-acyltransferase [Caulobacter hibisci]|uniref:Apolipoprotein N-acyltransferase n=1 Tax=Caulobacter hibisci TaxID=2035993 RepID=A0ABS0SWR5_9CAUL|nr:apolipoprotein N-acyltransferase [Caulobacter hibisci]MBI1683370.1 apolipoprotein N-acyltransferase [Caulobacter hibisci]
MKLSLLTARSPWRDRVLALVAGLAAALAHPPFGVLPGLLGYALLLWLLDGIDGPRPLRSAFLRGWLAGLGYFGLGTWWIGEAFLVDAANQGWMAPFAVAAMGAGLALFWGLAAVLYRRFRPAGAVRVLAFAAAFSALEWVRGHVLTGFPWNLPGETWRAGSAPSQAAALIGAYGLTFVTLAIAAAPAVWRQGREGRIAVGAALAVLGGLYGGGWLALRAAPPETTAGPRIRIVQANVGQSAKWDAASFQAIVRDYVSLTAQPPADGKPADIVVWPEGALPAAINDYMAPGVWVRQAIMDALEPGQLLLIGGYRYEGSAEAPTYYNSLVALRREPGGLTVVGVYDKHRLVPFGEYLPAEGLLTAIGIKSMAHLGDGFVTGPRPAPLTVAPGLKVQPLICYESLFPGLAKPDPAVRALVNVSNDAWFGVTSGPLQHLNLASYRAIEAGRPMIRSTPTGVSAMIDANGRVVGDQRLDLGRRGVIDANLPAIGRDTFASRLVDWPLALLILASVAICIGSSRIGGRKFAGLKDMG